MLIQHTRPRLKPPGYAVLRVRRDHPLAVGLVGCFVQGGQFGLGRDLVTGAAFTGTNTPTANLTPDGPAISYTGTAFVSAASQPIWNVTGDVTVAWRGVVRAIGSSGFLIGKLPSGGGGAIDTPWSFEFSNPTSGNLSFVRSRQLNAPLLYAVWQSNSTLITVNELASFSVSQPTAMELAPTFYKNGVADAGSTRQYGVDGTGASTGNTGPVQIARRHDGVSQLDGNMTIAMLASRQWAAKEHQRFAWAPYEVLEEAPTYHFLSGYVEPPPEPSVTATVDFQPHGVLRRRVRRQMWANVPEELKPVVALAEEWTEADPVRRAVDEALAQHARMTARTSAARRDRLIDEAKRAIIAAVERAAEMDDEEALIALL